MNRPRRRRFGTQRGLTLIEMLVAIALITVGVVGVAGGVAALEKNAQVTTDQTNLEVAMRQVSDYLRAPYNGDSTTTTQYQPCATSYTVPAAIGGKNLLSSASPPGPLLQIPQVTVTVATSATRVGVLTPTLPFKDCTTGVFAPQEACTASNCDWGVQRLTITLTSPNHRTLTRVIYKGIQT